MCVWAHVYKKYLRARLLLADVTVIASAETITCVYKQKKKRAGCVLARKTKNKDKGAHAVCIHGTGAIDSERTTHILRVEGRCPRSGRGAVSWWLFLLTLATREKRKR